MTLEHVYLPDSWVLSIETDDRYRDRADPLGTRDPPRLGKHLATPTAR